MRPLQKYFEYTIFYLTFENKYYYSSIVAVKKKKPIIKPVDVVEEDALPVEVATVENVVREDIVDGRKGSMIKKILLWSGIAIVIGALLGISWKLAYERGIVVGQQQVQERLEKEAVVEEKTPIPTPEEISKGKYTIEVLNGSGISGEAARVKALLEKEGFIVSQVGNADESDNEETVIQVKSSVAKEWIDLLKTALGSSLVVSEPTSLDEEKTTDVVVIVGSKKAE